MSNWQVSNLTGGRQKLQKTIVTIELNALDLCRIQSFIKIEAFANLRPNLWPKTWQVPILTEVKIDKHHESQKTSAWTQHLWFVQSLKFHQIEVLATLVQKYGLKDDRCQYWEVSNLTVVKNPKNLLSPLNSSPSICLEYKISSKLKHLPFFVQNYGLKDGRCQHRKLLSSVNSAPSNYSLCKILW